MKTNISRAHLALLVMTAVLLAMYAFGAVTSGETSAGLGLAGLGGMILDERGEFCDATALNTGAAGTYLIGDVIDLGSTTQDVGIGEDLYVVISVDTAVTSGGAATVQFLVASDAQAAIATDGSATQHLATPAIGKATLVAGYNALVAKLPPGTYERYLGILQVTGTAALTAGKVNAFLTHDISRWTAYPDGVN